MSWCITILGHSVKAFGKHKLPPSLRTYALLSSTPAVISTLYSLHFFRFCFIVFNFISRLITRDSFRAVLRSFPRTLMTDLTF